VQIYREATDWEGRRGGWGGIDMDEVTDIKLEKKVELQRTLSFFAWFIGGALGIWLLGLTSSLPLLMTKSKSRTSTSPLQNCCGMTWVR